MKNEQEKDVSRIRTGEATLERPVHAESAPVNAPTALTAEESAGFIAIEETMHAIGWDFEEMCSVYAKAFRADAARISDDTCKDCLLQAAESIEQAGLDWYVSTK